MKLLSIRPKVVMVYWAPFHNVYVSCVEKKTTVDQFKSAQSVHGRFEAKSNPVSCGLCM